MANNLFGPVSVTNRMPTPQVQPSNQKATTPTPAATGGGSSASATKSTTQPMVDVTKQQTAKNLAELEIFKEKQAQVNSGDKKPLQDIIKNSYFAQEEQRKANLGTGRNIIDLNKATAAYEAQKAIDIAENPGTKISDLKASLAQRKSKSADEAAGLLDLVDNNRDDANINWARRQSINPITNISAGLYGVADAVGDTVRGVPAMIAGSLAQSNMSKNAMDYGGQSAIDAQLARQERNAGKAEKVWDFTNSIDISDAIGATGYDAKSALNQRRMADIAEYDGSINTVGLSYNAGRMAPTMVAGRLTGAGLAAAGLAGEAAASIGGNVGLAAMYSSVYYDSMKESTEAGVSLSDAANKATLTAMAEVLPEKMFAGIPGLGEGWIKRSYVAQIAESKIMPKLTEKFGVNAASKTLIKATDPLSKALKDKLFDIAGEAAEEAVTEITNQAIIPNIIRTSEDPQVSPLNIGAVAEAAVSGALLSLALNGGEIFKTTARITNAQALQDSYTRFSNTPEGMIQKAQDVLRYGSKEFGLSSGVDESLWPQKPDLAGMKDSEKMDAAKKYMEAVRTFTDENCQRKIDAIKKSFSPAQLVENMTGDVETNIKLAEALRERNSAVKYLETQTAEITEGIASGNETVLAELEAASQKWFATEFSELTDEQRTTVINKAIGDRYAKAFGKSFSELEQAVAELREKADRRTDTTTQTILEAVRENGTPEEYRQYQEKYNAETDAAIKRFREELTAGVAVDLYGQQMVDNFLKWEMTHEYGTTGTIYQQNADGATQFMDFDQFLEHSVQNIPGSPSVSDLSSEQYATIAAKFVEIREQQVSFEAQQEIVDNYNKDLEKAGINTFKARLASQEEIARHTAPAWCDLSTGDMVINPTKILHDDVARYFLNHEIFHAIIRQGTGIDNFMRTASDAMAISGISYADEFEFTKAAYLNDAINEYKYSHPGCTLQEATEYAKKVVSVEYVNEEVVAKFMEKLFSTSDVVKILQTNTGRTYVKTIRDKVLYSIGLGSAETRNAMAKARMVAQLNAYLGDRITVNSKGKLTVEKDTYVEPEKTPEEQADSSAASTIASGKMPMTDRQRAEYVRAAIDLSGISNAIDEILLETDSETESETYQTEEEEAEETNARVEELEAIIAEREESIDALHEEIDTLRGAIKAATQAVTGQTLDELADTTESETEVEEDAVADTAGGITLDTLASDEPVKPAKKPAKTKSASETKKATKAKTEKKVAEQKIKDTEAKIEKAEKAKDKAEAELEKVTRKIRMAEPTTPRTGVGTAEEIGAAKALLEAVQAEQDAFEAEYKAAKKDPKKLTRERAAYMRQGKYGMTAYQAAIDLHEVEGTIRYGKDGTPLYVPTYMRSAEMLEEQRQRAEKAEEYKAKKAAKSKAKVSDVIKPASEKTQAVTQEQKDAKTFIESLTDVDTEEDIEDKKAKKKAKEDARAFFKTITDEQTKAKNIIKEVKDSVFKARENYASYLEADITKAMSDATNAKNKAARAKAEARAKKASEKLDALNWLNINASKRYNGKQFYELFPDEKETLTADYINAEVERKFGFKMDDAEARVLEMFPGADIESLRHKPTGVKAQQLKYESTQADYEAQKKFEEDFKKKRNKEIVFAGDVLREYNSNGKFLSKALNTSTDESATAEARDLADKQIEFMEWIEEEFFETNFVKENYGEDLTIKDLKDFDDYAIKKLKERWADKQMGVSLRDIEGKTRALYSKLQASERAYKKSDSQFVNVTNEGADLGFLENKYYDDIWKKEFPDAKAKGYDIPLDIKKYLDKQVEGKTGADGKPLAPQKWADLDFETQQDIVAEIAHEKAVKELSNNVRGMITDPVVFTSVVKADYDKYIVKLQQDYDKGVKSVVASLDSLAKAAGKESFGKATTPYQVAALRVAAKAKTINKVKAARGDYSSLAGFKFDGKARKDFAAEILEAHEKELDKYRFDPAKSNTMKALSAADWAEARVRAERYAEIKKDWDYLRAMYPDYNAQDWGDYWEKTLPKVTHDSEGRQLTPKQSKLASRVHPIYRDGQNRIIVQYHGTRSAGFEVFRDYNDDTDSIRRMAFTTPNLDFTDSYAGYRPNLKGRSDLTPDNPNIELPDRRLPYKYYTEISGLVEGITNTWFATYQETRETEDYKQAARRIRDTVASELLKHKMPVDAETIASFTNDYIAEILTASDIIDENFGGIDEYSRLHDFFDKLIYTYDDTGDDRTISIDANNIRVYDNLGEVFSGRSMDFTKILASEDFYPDPSLKVELTLIDEETTFKPLDLFDDEGDLVTERKTEVVTLDYSSILSLEKIARSSEMGPAKQQALASKGISPRLESLLNFAGIRDQGTLSEFAWTGTINDIRTRALKSLIYDDAEFNPLLNPDVLRDTTGGYYAVYVFSSMPYITDAKKRHWSKLDNSTLYTAYSSDPAENPFVARSIKALLAEWTEEKKTIGAMLDADTLKKVRNADPAAYEFVLSYMRDLAENISTRLYDAGMELAESKKAYLPSVKLHQLNLLSSSGVVTRQEMEQLAEEVKLDAIGDVSDDDLFLDNLITKFKNISPDLADEVQDAILFKIAVSKNLDGDSGILSQASIYDPNANATTDKVGVDAYNLGYDSWFAFNIDDNGPRADEGLDTITTSHGSVLKSVHNRDPHPEINNITKALPSVDADGVQLNRNQQYFFKDSVIRSSYGALQPVYPEGLSDRVTAMQGAFGNGYYFTDSENIYNPAAPKCYINMKNPYDVDAKGFTSETQIIAQGYDGLVYKRRTADGNQVTVYKVFDQAQFAEAGEGNPNQNPGERLALPSNSKQAMDEWYAMIGKQWSEKQAEYGTLPARESATSGLAGQVPKSVEDGKKTRGFGDNTAQHIPSQWELNMKQVFLEGKYSYTPITDKDAASFAESRAAKKTSINEQFADVMDLFDRGKINDKYDVAYAIQVMNNLAQYPETTGAWEMYNEIAGKTAAVLTRSAQMVQAASLITKLTPMGKLYYIEKSIDNYLDELKGQRDKAAGMKLDDIELDQEHKDAILNAKTAEELAEAEDAAIKFIANQIPPTVGDRVTAWRYLAMLGNPRTHIRNMVGNFGGSMFKSMKDFSGAIAEKSLQKGARTKSIFKTKDSLEFAKQDAIAMHEVLAFGGKQGYESRIAEARKMFSGSLLNFLDTLNSNALEAEDMLFLKRHYINSLAGYMTAKGWTSADLQGELVDNVRMLNEARQYALKEAWKATFRDDNKISHEISQIEKNHGFVGKILVGGFMPFKKVPINIVRRGLEYSPVGLIKTVELAYDKAAGKAKQDGTEVSSADIIDSLCAGLSGSACMAIGFALAGLGVAKGGGPDDDDEEYYEETQGYQKYSITIAGKNFTMDWFTPASLPFFAGVELCNAVKNDAELEDLDDILGAFANACIEVADPITELSVLSGVRDTLKTISYADDAHVLPKIAGSMAQSYASQFVPTLAGQTARTIDPYRRVTYASKETDFPGGRDAEMFVNKLENKIPFMSKKNSLYIDQWGRPQKRSDNLIARTVGQFASPAYVRDVDVTQTDDNIANLFAESKNNDVIPTLPTSSFSYDSTKYTLSPDEYEREKITAGQIKKAAVDSVFASSMFSSLSVEQKTEAITWVYDYATKIAQKEVVEGRGDEYELKSDIAKCNKLVSDGEMTIGEFAVIRAGLKATGYTKQAEKAQYLRTLGLSNNAIGVMSKNWSTKDN